MMQEDKKHEPVLLPKEEGRNAKSKSHEPILFSEDYGEKKINTPYILIALVLFGVLGAFWKMAVQKDAPLEPVKQSVKAIK